MNEVGIAMKRKKRALLLYIRVREEMLSPNFVFKATRVLEYIDTALLFFNS